ncbi:MULTISPECIES: DUF3152 domain-containing protein [Streptomyces]|uniref:DUF3152 domain-containing protein n=1 Tax=Streptomyces venezuelae TaxID=54571 RepID=A0A5P2AQT4_STRVZ|nr:DUF3152 domain-containing protein [Streptomyces venezuelae]QES19950.1 hypothetical protein DEJ46_13250 [Streptomyces venezuelae]
MGRHSRKGPAPSVPGTEQRAAAGRTAGTAAQGAAGQPRTAGTGQTGEAPGQAGGTGRRRRAPGDGQDATGTPAHGTPQYGTPAHGTPQYGTPQSGAPQYGPQSYGRQPSGPQSYGGQGYGGRTSSGQGYGGGVFDTPAHGTPGTPAYGIPAYGTTPVRGGHPQHDEGAGPRPEGYGHRRGSHRAAAPEQDTHVAEQADPQGPFIPGPRRESAAGADDGTENGDGTPVDGSAGRTFKGRTLTGIAAAAVTTVLAVVVAGQVADRADAPSVAHAADGPAERAEGDDSASRSDDRVTPSRPSTAAPAAPSASASAPAPTYEQLMTRQFPIDPKLTGSGDFEAVPGFQKAPGKGRLVRYRIDVEKGIGLDARLFASAVHKTLNDERSWAGQGAMTFERISSGEPQFVITLASPGTTGEWCRKSGLDTTVDNVSCDSASTERVMINAFRWAQGSETFGPKAMYAYRQMLINHEVGHRLGHGHVSCATPGALAPVMQQQTKSLKVDGIACRPNPWVYPGS